MVNKNDQLKIDFFVGWRGRPLDAMERSHKEFKKRISSVLNCQEFDYDSSIRLRQVPFLRQIPRIMYTLNMHQKRRKDSIVHLPNQKLGTMLHLDSFSPSIVYCHDIIEYVRPEYHDYLAARTFIYACHTGMLKADAIVTPSQFTADDIKKHFPSYILPIKVIPPGIDRARFHPYERRIFLRKLGLPENYRYMLYVGSEQPRKNVPAVIRTFIQARREFPKLALLKIGREDNIPGYPIREQILRDLRKMRMQNFAFFIQYVSDDLMPMAYSAADVFVFPTLYEGFGMPVLEAFACGTPVVATNTTAIPELGRDAALLVSPRDDDALYEAASRVLRDQEFKADLINRGLKRATEYTWDKSISSLLELYHQLDPRSA